MNFNVLGCDDGSVSVKESAFTSRRHLKYLGYDMMPARYLKNYSKYSLKGACV